jgi:Trk K+ transport system NAD-binding subunit
VQQTRSGVECYVRAFEELRGLTFADVRRRFDAAVVIGFMAKGGALCINPAEEEVLEDGARVVALAPNGASARAFAAHGSFGVDLSLTFGARRVLNLACNSE